jgi:signal transduction histidine kinase/CheY-like chemotaxis protein
MKLAPLLAIPMLIVLLSWLSMRAADSDASRYDRALGEIGRFAQMEADLNSDVLSARAGLLRNYDPLVQETNDLDTSLASLREIMAPEVTTVAAIDRLGATIDRQETLIEHFKTNNALLQNSLAYFALFSGNTTSEGRSNPLAPAISELAAAMLRLTLDTSSGSEREVQGRLNQLAAQAAQTDGEQSAAALLAHGRLLIELLPATDGILRALRSLHRASDRDAVQAMILKQQADSRAVAGRFRMFLYVTSLLLVGLLGYVGLQLRSRARALRRRAAFEHALAGISMRFISVRPYDLDLIIDSALGELARCVGAERAYFLLGDTTERIFTWCASGVAFAPGWPARARMLMGWDYPSFEGVVLVPRVGRLPCGDRKAALAIAGIKGWACVSGKIGDGGSVLLGFDAVTHPCQIMRSGELGLLRMALDSIANALGRRTLEQERSRLETRLQQARRLETVGTLASGIAHNFNNIIGAILGYTEIAGEQNASTPVIDEIRRAGERARELVDQILTFARHRDAQPVPIRVGPFMAEAISLLRVSLPPTIELKTDDAPGDCFVSGVAAQLQQVVLNLANNAAQAMSFVGCITLEVEPVDLVASRQLSQGVLTAGRFVRIAVNDTGHGIDAAIMNRIFEPFFTTRISGNGLGLATSRDIVREHGGTMHVQSASGTGSRFEVWLPRIDSTAAGATEVTAARPFGRGETVLLVETDPERLLRDEELLAALGYEPVGYTCAAGAQEAFQDAPDRFDALVVGPLAPSASALELAAEIHNLAPGMPILLAATSCDELGANSLVVAGIADVVRWPLAASEIATALQDCLR